MIYVAYHRDTESHRNTRSKNEQALFESRVQILIWKRRLENLRGFLDPQSSRRTERVSQIEIFHGPTKIIPGRFFCDLKLNNILWNTFKKYFMQNFKCRTFLPLFNTSSSFCLKRPMKNDIKNVEKRRDVGWSKGTVCFENVSITDDAISPRDPNLNDMDSALYSRYIQPLRLRTRARVNTGAFTYTIRVQTHTYYTYLRTKTNTNLKVFLESYFCRRLLAQRRKFVFSTAHELLWKIHVSRFRNGYLIWEDPSKALHIRRDLRVRLCIRRIRLYMSSQFDLRVATVSINYRRVSVLCNLSGQI